MVGEQYISFQSNIAGLLVDITLPPSSLPFFLHLSVQNLFSSFSLILFFSFCVVCHLSLLYHIWKGGRRQKKSGQEIRMKFLLIKCKFWVCKQISIEPTSKWIYSVIDCLTFVFRNSCPLLCHSINFPSLTWLQNMVAVSTRAVLCYAYFLYLSGISTPQTGERLSADILQRNCSQLKQWKTESVKQMCCMNGSN